MADIKKSFVKKVTLDPDDFMKVVDYLFGQQVPFGAAAQAVEVQEILKKAQIMNIDVQEKPKGGEPGAGSK
jgi:hypothetical protein